VSGVQTYLNWFWKCIWKIRKEKKRKKKKENLPFFSAQNRSRGGPLLFFPRARRLGRPTEQPGRRSSSSLFLATLTPQARLSAARSSSSSRRDRAGLGLRPEFEINPGFNGISSCFGKPWPNISYSCDLRPTFFHLLYTLKPSPSTRAPATLNRRHLLQFGEIASYRPRKHLA
jgi:hypothetical protein